jgi:antirestriction protein ArdC
MAKQRSKAKQARRDIYQEVTDRILELLEAGTVPWRNPIHRKGGGGWPINLDSGKKYRGVNVFLLATVAWATGYGSDYWLTFKQAQKLGGKVRKGEKSSLVVFWKQYDTKDKETGEDISIPVLKHYNVFNAEQCEGIEPPDAAIPDPNAEPFRPIQAAREITLGYPGMPKVIQTGSRAFYRPSTDEITIPKPELFNAPEGFYATLFHETVHSTGHSKRLDRGLDTNLAPFGSIDYSKEELIAEMGAAFLAAAAGISPPTIEQSAAYIAGWQKRLKGDKRLVVSAAASAQKAVDLILGTTFDEAADPPKVIHQRPHPSDGQHYMFWDPD